jgi:16S rRNA (guanine966-N2)-methyltransferase
VTNDTNKLTTESAKGNSLRARHTVRIIAGHWRHRLIRFDPGEALRPTPDGVRETVFNWLIPFIKGARCLDLFAGSGALGFEALSRGAAQVTMVDHQRPVCHRLRENCELLGTTQINIVCSGALTYLRQTFDQFDIIFIDPPYNTLLATQTFNLLDRQTTTTPDGVIYVESGTHKEPLVLPSGWEIFRQKAQGEVRYQLCQKIKETVNRE